MILVTDQTVGRYRDFFRRVTTRIRTLRASFVGRTAHMARSDHASWLRPFSWLPKPSVHSVTTGNPLALCIGVVPMPFVHPTHRQEYEHEDQNSHPRRIRTLRRERRLVFGNRRSSLAGSPVLLVAFANVASDDCSPTGTEMEPAP